MKSRSNKKILATNRFARFNMDIQDTITAGISLLGPEVKSIRNGHISLKEARVWIFNGEAILLGMHISSYKNSSSKENYDPTRQRKLLLKKSEINRLLGKIKSENIYIVIGDVFSSDNGWIKLTLLIGKTVKKADRREKEKKKEWDKTKKFILG